MSYFVLKIFTTKFRSRRENDQMHTVLAANFWRNDPNFLRQIVSTIYRYLLFTV